MIATNGLPRRWLAWCTAWANASLPHPVSPRSSSGTSRSNTRTQRRKSFCKAGSSRQIPGSGSRWGRGWPSGTDQTGARAWPRRLANTWRPSRVSKGQTVLPPGTARLNNSSGLQAKKRSTGLPSTPPRMLPSRLSALWLAAQIRPSPSKANKPSLNKPTDSACR
ncbi:hypothetical protein D3C81_1114370 [compost metagenome]